MSQPFIICWMGRAFRGILGNSRVEAQIEEAMRRALRTPNVDGVAGNGSEFGFWAGRGPTGVQTWGLETSYREHDVSTSAGPFWGADRIYRDLVFIHVHQSPTANPGLSNRNGDIENSNRINMNVVAVSRSGERYCHVGT